MDHDFRERRISDRREGPRRADEVELLRERRETISELSDLFAIVQKMGKRLADETHGDAYEQVLELNEKLHEVRQQLNRIGGNDG